MSSPVIVTYKYAEMEALPGSGDLLVRRYLSEMGNKYTLYFKMLKWNKRSAWLISCDSNGVTHINDKSERVSWRDCPRYVLKKSAPLALTN